MRTSRAALPVAAALVAIITVGCGSSAKQAKSVEPAATSTVVPRVLTDLSSLSEAPLAAELPEDLSAIRDTTGIGNLESFDNAEAQRAYLATPGVTLHVGTDQYPGEEKLLNPKAAKFAEFSRALLNRVYNALHEIELTEQVARHKFSRDLKPVLVTAVLSKEGRLLEIILERHSGQAMMDKLIIDACKKGLWYSNPPQAALTPEGNYRVRLEGKIKNYASMKGEKWRFHTYVGLALL